jgi:hypothetical protein
MGIPRPGGGYVAPGKNYVLYYIVVHQCRMPKQQTGLCLFLFMPLSFLPLSVYAPFRFGKFSILPNSFLPLSIYAPFRFGKY